MIISQVLMSKKNRANEQQRIVCAMSFIDVIVSTVWFLTNLFIPSEIDEFPLARGNKASCSAQGFIVQFSISSIIYNAALSFYYLLIIKYNYKSQQLRKFEVWIHIAPISFGLITAYSALKLDIYHFATWDCWIAPTQSGEGEKLARILQWAFFFAPLWCAILFATGNMIQVFDNVRRREKISSEWMRKRASGSSPNPSANSRAGFSTRGVGISNPDVESTSNKSEFHFSNIDSPEVAPGYSKNSDGDSSDSSLDQRQHLEQPAPQSDESHVSREGSIQLKCTRRVAHQALMYVGAFFITWMFPTISRIIELCGHDIPPYLVVLSGTFIPSQGIFNALVYFRLRFIRCSQNNPTKPKCWVIRRIIKLTLCPCFERRESRYNMNDGNDVEPLTEAGAGLHRRSSVSHSTEDRPKSHRLRPGEAGLRSQSNPSSYNISYPSFPSDRSSERSFFVSETEPEKSGAESEADVDPAKAAEKIARVVCPASINPHPFYERAREMVRRDMEAVVANREDETGSMSTEPVIRTYRDVFNLRKTLIDNNEVESESENMIGSSLNRISDFLSTIEEGSEVSNVYSTTAENV